MKHTKLIIKVSVCLIIIGIVMASIGYATGGNTNFSFLLNLGKLEYYSNENKIEKTDALDEFKDVNIDINYSDVQLIKSNENKIELHYSEEAGEIKYKVENGVLYITQDSKSKNNAFINFGHDGSYNNYIKIYVKEDSNLNSIKSVISNGDFDISGFTANNLDLALNFGDGQLNNCNFDNLVLNNSNGEVEINNIVVGSKAEITDNFGDVIINNSTITDLDTNMSNGDFEALSSTINGIDIENNFGEVTISDCTVSNLYATLKNGDFEGKGNFDGDITIENSFGEIELDMKNDIKYNYSIQCSFGDVTVDGKEFEGNVNSNNKGDNNLTISSSNGDVTVNFKN